MENKKIAASLMRLAKQLVSNDAPSENEVIDFFAANQNPTDAQVHGWAEDNGYDVHKTEEVIYGLATKYANFAAGGLSNKEGFKKEDADPEQLKMGIKVEHEHTPDGITAEKIALDHLAELPNYYTLLDEMESAAEKE